MKNYYAALVCTLLATSMGAHAQTNPIAAPFQDFNLIRDEIPQVLIEAQRERYPDTKNWSCELIAERREELTKVLGPDEQEHKDKDLGDRASEAVQKALTDTTTGWIPFRGWIRKLTGAERHAQKVANAWEAGILQRAFLYGIQQARCGSETSSKAPTSPVKTENAQKILQDTTEHDLKDLPSEQNNR